MLRLRRSKLAPSRVAAIIGAAATLHATSAGAQTTWTASASAPASWSQAANWSIGVPTEYQKALINNGGTALITSGTNRAAELYLGNGPADVGHVQMSGGFFKTENGQYIGYNGTGTFVQTAGTNGVTSSITDGFSDNSNWAIYLGYNPGAAGTYQLSGTGRIRPSSNAIQSHPIYVGYSGQGTFQQSGGSLSVSDKMYLGYYAGSSGTYQLTGGSVSTFVKSSFPPGALYVGYGGQGQLIQSGGTFTNVLSPLNLYLGYSLGSTGLYHLAGGTASWSTIYAGYSGAGAICQSAGTLSGTIRLGAAGLYELSAGQYTGSISTGSGRFTQYGGTVSGTLTVSAGGLATVTGGAISATGLVSVAAGGRLQLNGGAHSLSSVANAGAVDLAGSTFFYSGLADFGLHAPTGAHTASLTGGAGSLLVVPAGFDPYIDFGTFTTAGLVHTEGSALAIAAGATITGVGTIRDRVDAAGTVTGSISFTRGLTVASTGSVTGSSLTITDATSGISGTGYAKFTSVTLTPSATFTQFGGQVTASSLFTAAGARYELSGGTLTLTNVENNGTLDFASGPATLLAGGIANLARGAVLAAHQASVTLSPNGLLILPTGFDPATGFKTLSATGGVVHVAGSSLTISSGQSVNGAGNIDDPVICSGSISGSGSSVNLNGGVSISGTGRVNLGPTGVVRVNSLDSGISGGTLTAMSLYVGQQSEGLFTQSGGSVTAINQYLGAQATATGTHRATEGTASITNQYIGYAAAGTLDMTGGVLNATNQYVGYSAPGSVTLSGGRISSTKQYVGYFADGSFTHSLAGTNIFSTLYLGYGEGVTGTYRLAGGSISTFTTTQYVGYGGTGAFIHESGTNSGTNASLTLGELSGSTGTYQLLGGSASFRTWHVGDAGSGSVLHNAGTATAGSLYLGYAKGSSGAYALSTGRLSATNELYVGQAGTGSFSQTGGTNSVAGTLVLGYATGSTGSYTLDAGLLIVGDGEYVGDSGSGTFKQTGGTHTVTGSLRIGDAISSTAAGHYDLSGGQLTVTGDQQVGRTGSSTGVTGTFSQTGGTNAAGFLAVSPTGRYQLAAGTLQVGQGIGNDGIINFSGAAGSLTAGGLVNFNRGTWLNLDQLAVTGQPGSLLIFPAGFDPLTQLRGFTAQGLYMNSDGAVDLAAGQTHAWRGNIDGHVNCAGTLTPLTGATLTLTGGLMATGAANVSLGPTGRISINNLMSGISGGTISAGTLSVAGNADASFTQAGGTVTGVSTLTVGSGAGATGRWSQAGGLLSATTLTLGTTAGATGHYLLTAGQLTTSNLFVGSAGAATFTQTGGANSAGFLSIGPSGRYVLTGGTLTTTRGLHNAGTLDFADQPAALSLAGVANFAPGTLSGASQVDVTGLANSLVLFPPGFDPQTAFKSFTTAGLTHAAGTTLVIPAGKSFSGTGTITDPVESAGTMSGTLTFNAPVLSTGRASGTITFAGGVTVPTGGVVTGTVTADGPSRVSGGLATLTQVGRFGPAHFLLESGTVTIPSTAFVLNVASGPGVSATFDQTGGTVSLPSSLRVGAVAGAVGTYRLSAGLLNITRPPGSTTGGIVILGLSGGVGTFIQSGGVHTLGESVPPNSFSYISAPLYIGYGFFSSGTYQLTGGDLKTGSETIGHDGGVGTFEQTGGVHSVTTTLAVTKGRMTLAGGTLSAGKVQVDPGGTFHQTGGTLSAASFYNSGTALLGGVQNWAPGTTFTSTATTQFTTDAGGPSNNPTLRLNVTAGTTTLASSQHLASLDITGNALAALSPGDSKLLFVKSLAIGDSAALDLADGALAWDYTSAAPAESLRAWLLAGRAAGSWAGPGVRSSTAASDPHATHAIGHADASDLLGLTPAETATWMGQAVDSTTLLALYTHYGDANLDGLLTPDDFALLDRGFALGLQGWVNGDFDYDGLVGASDYLLVDRALVNQSGMILPALLARREAQFGPDYVRALTAVVPEPGLLWPSTVWVAMSNVGFVCWRRPRRLIPAQQVSVV